MFLLISQSIQVTSDCRSVSPVVSASPHSSWILIDQNRSLDLNTGFLLVNTDHVTSILASYWSIPGTGSNLALRKLSLDGEVVLRQGLSLYVKMMKLRNANVRLSGFIWFKLVWNRALNLFGSVRSSGCHN